MSETYKRFQKDLELELKNYYGTKSSHEMVIGNHFAEWAFEWIDSKHIQKRLEAMKAYDSLKQDAEELVKVLKTRYTNDIGPTGTRIDAEIDKALSNWQAKHGGE